METLNIIHFATLEGLFVLLTIVSYMQTYKLGFRWAGEKGLKHAADIAINKLHVPHRRKLQIEVNEEIQKARYHAQMFLMASIIFCVSSIVWPIVYCVWC